MRIAWDQLGERLYEAGVDRCVLYVGSNPGVPWSGIVQIQETPSGGAPTPFYFDGEKYLQVSAPEEYAATLTAYTYPDEFGVCDGSAQIVAGMFVQHQPRKSFSLVYRTLIANEVAGTNFGYKIHLVYNAMAAPTQRANKSLSGNVDVSNFAWNLSSVPQSFTGFKNSGHIILDTRYLSAGTIAVLENILYGDSTSDPRIPDISELVDIVTSASTVVVIDNGDGTFTVLGPDADVFMPDPNDLTINWTSVITTVDQFTVSSL